MIRKNGMRKFEIVRDFAIKYNVSRDDIIMPIRATKFAAGYDFFSPIEITIPSMASEVVWSNIKADMLDDEFLMLAVTSGMGKRGLILSNAIGVIDKDYYSNDNTDGNIGFWITNLGSESYTIKVGEKIGQGIFVKYLTTDVDNCKGLIRDGGFGSTDNKVTN